MKKVLVITDSGSAITPDIATKLGIKVIPLRIITNNNEEIIDDGTIETQNFKAVLKTNRILKTSMANVGTLEQEVKQALTEYDLVAALPIAQSLSSTYSTWKGLENILEDPRFYVFDSADIWTGMQWACELVKSSLENGKSFAEVQELLNERKSVRYGFVTTLDLSRLRASGRMNKWQAVLATALRVNVTASFDGTMKFFCKARSVRQAFDKVYKKLTAITNSNANAWRIAFGSFLTGNNAETNNNYMLEKLSNLVGKSNVFLSEIPKAIAVHIGINCFGIYVDKK